MAEAPTPSCMNWSRTLPARLTVCWGLPKRPALGYPRRRLHRVPHRPPVRSEALLLETVHPSALAALEESVTVVTAPAPDRLPSRSVLADVVAILTRGRGQVAVDLLDACPNLRVVARCGVGLDNIDLDAASVRGIPVLNAPGSTTATVAEHTMALILHLRRRLDEQIALHARGPLGRPLRT